MRSVLTCSLWIKRNPTDIIRVLGRHWLPPRRHWDIFPEMAQGKKLVMHDGYDRPLMWLSSDQIRDEWKPLRRPPCPVPLPPWVKPGHTHIWHVNGKQPILDHKTGQPLNKTLRMEFTAVNHSKNSAWVQCLHEPTIQDPGVFGFLWCRQKFSAFYVEADTIRQNMSPNEFWSPSYWEKLQEESLVL